MKRGILKRKQETIETTEKTVPETPKKQRIGTPTTPASPLQKTLRTPISIYQDARQMFRRCTTPKKLVGRQVEKQQLSHFLTTHLLQQKPGSMYISGCPGTGKTALVKEVLDELSSTIENLSFSIKLLHINCMNFQDPKQIFGFLSRELDWDAQDQASCQQYLVPEKITPKTPMYLLVLDEIDQLATKEKQVLYSFFEMAKLENSRLVLIGIANQLDLTTKFLPRLQTKNCEPQYIKFDPYKVNEISAIIKDRLDGLTPTKDQNGKPELPVMQTMAVEMAARKLAGTGDLRKALDVCRHAIQIVEKEVEKTQVENLKVGVKHVLTAANAMLGSTQTNRLQSVPLHGKIILVTLVIMTEAKLEPTMTKVEHCYRSLCRYRKTISSLGQTEFLDVMNQLQDMAIVHLNKKRKEFVVAMNVNPKDVKAFDVPIIKELLEFGSKAVLE